MNYDFEWDTNKARLNLRKHGVSMNKEYDFSKGTRGKFFRPNAKLNMPVYLDTEVQDFVQRVAEHKRTDDSAVVNLLLSSDMKLVDSVN